VPRKPRQARRWKNTTKHFLFEQKPRSITTKEKTIAHTEKARPATQRWSKAVSLQILEKNRHMFATQEAD
jgi:hypothetical protein